MGLDGTGEIQAFFSLVPFRLLGYFEQSITEIEIPPLRKMEQLTKDVVCLPIPFLFRWLYRPGERGGLRVFCCSY